MADPLPKRSDCIPPDRLLVLLTEGEMELEGQFVWGSNYTFLAQVADQELSAMAVYKPSAGERPLWDFDHASLARREVAAYRLSVFLGWPNVPPTILRDGPHGPGSVQLYIDAEHQEHFFSLRERGSYDAIFQQLALFDFVINNADRKGGHCLLGHDGRIWSIDHGLAFHREYKLRTVIWDYAGRPIPADWLDELGALHEQFAAGQARCQELAQLITPQEIEAMNGRLRDLIESAAFPQPGPGRNVPYPLI